MPGAANPSRLPSMSRMEIEDKIKALPTSPGVYLMKGKKGILYIGKAKNLRARVRSYFRKTGDTRYAARFLASRVEDIDYIVTSTETEALILEDTLLKKHKPRYNIRLKDDKTYVSIKLTVNEPFPRILVTRLVKDDGARYFGPYASARTVRETLKLLRRIFPLRVCTDHEFRNRVRPCIDYQLGLCSAPAAGLIAEDAYRELVDGAVMFLEGRDRELVRMLEKKMYEASRAHEFERAALLRDRIHSIEAMFEEQKVVSARGTDQDVFGYCRDDEHIAVVALFIRNGRLISTRDFTFPYTGLPPEDVFSSLLSQFYRRTGAFVPDEVLVPVRLDDASVIAEWLGSRKGRKVTVKRPLRGTKAGLVEMANANARETLRKAGGYGEEEPLEELQRRLRLARPPVTIEAFDISNIGGREAVGAMVTFVKGRPCKDRYRLYRIRTAEGPDDYAMMYEVLSRRYGRTREGDRLPDLVVVDGGKGQLMIAMRVMEELGIKDVSLAALAKERVEKGPLGKKTVKGERVYLPGRKDPVYLREGSKGDLLLRRIRDEVHRFAIGYHRRLRKKGIASVLDGIPGIGRKRRRILFDRFGDLDGIRKASIEELASIPGITERLARAIKEALA